MWGWSQGSLEGLGNGMVPGDRGGAGGAVGLSRGGCCVSVCVV